MYDGIINVYKEKGFTSHDVVAKMRGILGQRKIGHTGTLDPEAEGVLPVCAGKGTKLCDMLIDHDKTYRAVLLLGTETDTEDTTGAVLETKDTSGLTENEVRDAVCSFIGERPGLATAESMSAYISYMATVGMPEARRTVVSNIHKNGVPAVEAGAYIVDLLALILEKKASGVDLKK